MFLFRLGVSLLFMLLLYIWYDTLWILFTCKKWIVEAQTVCLVTYFFYWRIYYLYVIIYIYIYVIYIIYIFVTFIMYIIIIIITIIIVANSVIVISIVITITTFMLSLFIPPESFFKSSSLFLGFYSLNWFVTTWELFFT